MQAINEQDNIFDIAVMGSGISGLSAAYQLKKKNYRVILLEKEKRAGGKIETFRDSECISEFGPDTFLQKSPHLMRLIADLNLSSELIASTPDAKKRYIYLHNKLVQLPIGLKQFLGSSFLSPLAKMRLAIEPLINKKKDKPNEAGETVADFFSRRMGKQSVRNLFDPFVSGIYAGNVHKLGVKENFSGFYHIEKRYGNLFAFMQKAMKKMAKRKKAGYQPKSGMHSFSEGLETLVEGFLARLHNELQLNTQIKRIQVQNGIWHIQTDKQEWRAKSIVWATPAYETAKYIEPFAKEAAALLKTINYPPLATGTIYFRSEHVPHPMDGFGFLIPRAEKISLLGCIWHGSLFPEHVAPGYKAFRFYIGGDTAPELALLPEKEIIQIVVSDLKKCMQIHDQYEPAFYQFHREIKAIPQYYPGHREKIQHCQRLLQSHPGIILAGNYLKGVSLNDCIEQSNRSAYAAMQYLAKQSAQR